MNCFHYSISDLKLQLFFRKLPEIRGFCMIYPPFLKKQFVFCCLCILRFIVNRWINIRQFYACFKCFLMSAGYFTIQEKVSLIENDFMFFHLYAKSYKLNKKRKERLQSLLFCKQLRKWIPIIFYPQTSSAISFTRANFAHCSSSVNLFPTSQEANPHCGLRQSRSRGIY